MNKKFLANIAFLISVNLLIKPFWFFGIEVSVQNRLNNSDYGMYFSLLSFSVIFNILLDLGITNFNNREIARHNQLVSKYFSNIAIIKLLLGLFYLGISIVAGLTIGYNHQQFMLLLLLCFNQFLSSLILYLRSNINGLMLFVTDSILSVLDKTLMILLCSLLLWASIPGITFSITWFVYAQTISYLLTALTALIIVLRKVQYFRPRVSIPHIVLVFKKSLPFSILVLLMSLYNRLEPIFLERLLPDGKEQAGLYAQAFRMLDVLSNYALLFPVLLLPLFSKMLKAKENVAELVNMATLLLLVPAILVSVLATIFSGNIMQLLYHKQLSQLTFAIVINGFIGISTTYIFGTLLTANGSLKALNIMAIGAVIINVLLNLILVPLFKAEGSAFASVTTQSLTAIAQVIIAYKLIKMPVNFALWGKLLAFAIAAVAIGLLSKALINNWPAAFLVAGVAGLAIALATKLINVKEIFRLVKEG